MTKPRPGRRYRFRRASLHADRPRPQRPGRAFPSLNQPFVSGSIETPAGKAPGVESKLNFRDRLGAYKVRWAIGRMRYRIDPGLYALGAPDADSPVLISANFKMSFDLLREALNPGRNAWILVLDTDGINVWCAAGKGTFGTEELTGRIESSGLARVVRHRRVIVPQLGAPGISAHEVQKLSGFKVVYGPVRAADLPEFMDSGMKAGPGMRMKTFTTGERLSLVPVEMVHAFKTLLMVLPLVLLLSGFSGHGGFFSNALRFGGFYSPWAYHGNSGRLPVNARAPALASRKGFFAQRYLAGDCLRAPFSDAAQHRRRLCPRRARWRLPPGRL